MVITVIDYSVKMKNLYHFFPKIMSISNKNKEQGN